MNKNGHGKGDHDRGGVHQFRSNDSISGDVLDRCGYRCPKMSKKGHVKKRPYFGISALFRPSRGILGGKNRPKKGPKITKKGSKNH